MLAALLLLDNNDNLDKESKVGGVTKTTAEKGGEDRYDKQADRGAEGAGR